MIGFKRRKNKRKLFERLDMEGMDLKYKTIANKLINIPNENAQNPPFCKLQLVVETFENSS